MLGGMREELYQAPGQPPEIAWKRRGEKTCVTAGLRLFQQHVTCDFVLTRQRSRGDERIVEGIEHECRDADMAQPPSRRRPVPIIAGARRAVQRSSDRSTEFAHRTRAAQPLA